MSDFVPELENGTCDKCGAEEEEVMWLPCCGGWACHDCHARHEDKWEIPDQL